MRLCSFRAGDRERLGVAVVDPGLPLDVGTGTRARVMAADALLADGPATLSALLAGGAAALDRLVEAARAHEARIRSEGTPLSELALLAPVPRPGKIVAIGLNYHAHAAEQGREPPREPLIFAKFTTAVVGPGAVVSWDPALTAEVDYEAELAVVVGRRTRHVGPDEALAHVLGYTVANDVTARDLQAADRQWVRGKSLDTFGPLGPLLVTADELPDPQVLRLGTLVNGERLQDGSTADMIFPVRELLAYCSRAFTLEPGDVLLTGTPSGVGVYRDPPRFLHDGDVMAVTIEGIGTLTNPCRELDPRLSSGTRGAPPAV
jgi:2-keto-4-pentenoate hydratase/2-oxohepta-3-ene-1,7-dioic acid hydratase in catechol pathway